MLVFGRVEEEGRCRPCPNMGNIHATYAHATYLKWNKSHVEPHWKVGFCFLLLNSAKFGQTIGYIRHAPPHPESVYSTLLHIFAVVWST